MLSTNLVNKDDPTAGDFFCVINMSIALGKEVKHYCFSLLLNIHCGIAVARKPVPDLA